MSSLTSLRAGAFVFIAAWLVHTADHARRGLDDTTETVVWAGTFVGLLAAVSITLILVRHPTAPAIAAVVFPSIAFGVIASHLVPEWSALSDPLLVESATDRWSILAASGEIIAAVMLGVAAVRVMRRNEFAFRTPDASWA